MNRKTQLIVLAVVIALAVALALAGEEEKVFFFSSGGSWLGVSLADVDSSISKELGLKEERGARIQSVVPGSPAAEAGLKEGDVVLEYHGQRIEGVEQLTRLVRETPPGRTVSLEVWRDRAARTVQVKVGEKDLEAMKDLHGLPGHGGGPHAIHIPPINIPDITGLEGRGSSRLGAMVETLTEQLGEYFGVKNGEGVLVRSVKKGSAGEAAGLRAGDVIVKVDDQSIGDASDLRLALRERDGKDVSLAVVRDKREQTLKVKLPKSDTSEGEGHSRAIILRHHGDVGPEVLDEIDDARGEVARALAEAGINREEMLKAGEEARKAAGELRRSLKEQHKQVIKLKTIQGTGDTI